MLDILIAVARKLIVIGLVWLVAKGWVTSDQAKHDLPDIISWVTLGLTVAGALGGEWIQRYYTGLTKNSPIAPSNLPSLQTPTKDINTKAKIIALNPATPESKIP